MYYCNLGMLNLLKGTQLPQVLGVIDDVDSKNASTSVFLTVYVCVCVCVFNHRSGGVRTTILDNDNSADSFQCRSFQRAEASKEWDNQNLNGGCH